MSHLVALSDLFLDWLKSISISQLENAFESLRANGKTANNEDLDKDNTKLGDILQSIL